MKGSRESSLSGQANLKQAKFARKIKKEKTVQCAEKWVEQAKGGGWREGEKERGREGGWRNRMEAQSFRINLLIRR